MDMSVRVHNKDEVCCVNTIYYEMEYPQDNEIVISSWAEGVTRYALDAPELWK